MNKKVLIFGGIAVAGVAGFFVYKKFFSSPDPLIATGTVNPNLVTQPSQTYPYVDNSSTAVRQDTASQPWYTQSTAFQPTSSKATSLGVDTNFLQNVSYVEGFASVTESVGSIWDNLSGMFGTSDSPATSTETASLDFNWDSMFS